MATNMEGKREKGKGKGRGICNINECGEYIISIVTQNIQFFHFLYSNWLTSTKNQGTVLLPLRMGLNKFQISDRTESNI
jgi:hypothetical protein